MNATVRKRIDLDFWFAHSLLKRTILRRAPVIIHTINLSLIFSEKPLMRHNHFVAKKCLPYSQQKFLR